MRPICPLAMLGVREKSAWQPASQAERWLPYAGMPPARLSIAAGCIRFQAMNEVFRSVKSFSARPNPRPDTTGRAGLRDNLANVLIDVRRHS